jgi:hypothetical protein
MLVEQLDELCEVRQGPGQTVDLVDNDDVNLACPYVLQQSLQGRPVGVATREAAIVVFAAQDGPARVSLALLAVGPRAWFSSPVFGSG